MSSGSLGSPGTYSTSAGERDALPGFIGNALMPSGSRCSPETDFNSVGEEDASTCSTGNTIMTRGSSGSHRAFLRLPLKKRHLHDLLEMI